MRMWMVNPKLMCRKHLLGEHLELHMTVGAIRKGKSLEGYIENGLIDTSKIVSRHEELVKEMARRGYHHVSPLPKFSFKHAGKVDVKENEVELRRRCEGCRRRVCGTRC